MAVKKKKNWKAGRLRLPGSGQHTHDNGGGTQEEVAARLAPLEETKEFAASAQSKGKLKEADDTIHVGSGDIKMPEHLGDEDRDAASTFRINPAVAVLLVVVLGFIAFVAWQITLMPEK